jgi:hypothetical protein
LEIDIEALEKENVELEREIREHRRKLENLQKTKLTETK